MKNKGYLYVICPFFTQNRKKHPYNYAQGSQNRHLMGPMRGGLDPPWGGSPPVALWFSRGQHPESFGNRWFLPKFEHFCPFQSYFRPGFYPFQSYFRHFLGGSAAIQARFLPIFRYFRPFPRRISGKIGQIFRHFSHFLGISCVYRGFLGGSAAILAGFSILGQVFTHFRAILD